MTQIEKILHDMMIDQQPGTGFPFCKFMPSAKSSCRKCLIYRFSYVAIFSFKTFQLVKRKMLEKGFSALSNRHLRWWIEIGNYFPLWWFSTWRIFDRAKSCFVCWWIKSYHKEEIFFETEIFIGLEIFIWKIFDRLKNKNKEKSRNATNHTNCTSLRQSGCFGLD